MKVVYVPIKGNPFPCEIDETLEMFQALVEGPFNYEPVTPNMALVYNDDQWTQPDNFTYKGQKVRGPAFFVGLNGRHWGDCPQTKEEILNDIV